MKIKIFYEQTKYRFPGWRKAAGIIVRIIENERLLVGDLKIIITKDSILRPINAEFLNHDYNTDVIAFDYGSEGIVNGEIYISKDTVKANSINYNVSLKREMIRVMIHGVLHLIGYRDGTREERIKMTEIEDKWIPEFFK